MNTSFELFPEQASTMAHKVDRLYLFELGVAVGFTALICALILYFGVKYRRGSRADRGNPPQSNLLELMWAALPLVLSMVMFAWGADLYFDQQTGPDNSAREREELDIEVVGKQWMWKIRHPWRCRAIKQLHVPLGYVVRLRMISEDVIHSFYVPEFRIKQDVLPGRYSTMWFQPSKTGTFHLFCAEYCGTEHSRMIGEVIVQTPAEYSAWVSGETGEPAEVRGRRLFEQHGCLSCHRGEDSSRGPSLAGVFGRQVALSSGQAVVADEAYLRESILNPRAKVVAGYQPVMPTYQGQIAEGDVLELIAYLKSLGGTRDSTKSVKQP